MADFNPQDFAEKIKKALVFSTNVGRIKGSDRISELDLDSESVAKKTIKINKEVI